MKKLSVDEAVSIVKLAQESCATIPGYRLGQAIWNLLDGNGHKELTSHFNNTDKDFFYWLDDNKVLSCFYDNFVED